MTSNFIQQLKRSLFVSVPTKKFIFQSWHTFDERKKLAITRLIEKTDKIQTLLIQKAIQKNPNFYVQLKFSVLRKSAKAKRKAEEENQEKMEEFLEQDLLASLKNS